MARKIIVNLGQNDYPGAPINVLKFSDLSLAGSDTPALLDDNNYPITTLGSNYGGTAPVLGGMSGPTEQWVIKWPATRDTRFTINTPVTKVSSTFSFNSGGSNSAYTMGGAGGRAVFTFPSHASSTISVFFPAGSFYSPGSGEICICRVSDEAAYDAGDYWTPEFIDLVDGLKPLAIRPLGWMVSASNVTNVTRYAYRTTLNNISWATRTYKTGMWGGAISGTDTYTIGSAPDSPADWTDGEMIQGRLANANTSTTPTLQIGSRSAKTIAAGDGSALSVGQLAANSNPVFVYDGLLGKVLFTGNVVIPTVPVEARVQLADRLGCALWDVYPSIADDDYITQEATYVRDNASSLTAYYPEYNNEIWNFAFRQTVWARNRGGALGFTSTDDRDVYGWYGLRARQMMGIITALWNVSTPLKRVLALKAAGDSTATNTYRLNGADLTTSFSGYNSWVGVNYNSAPNRPVDYCDVLSYATYYQGAAMNDGSNYTAGTNAALIASLQSMVDTWVGGDTAGALALLDTDIRTRTAGFGAQTLIALFDTVYPRWDTVAIAQSKKVACYEGGLQCLAPTTAQCAAMGVTSGGDAAVASAALAALLAAYKGSTYAYRLATDQFDQFFSFAGSESDSWLAIIGSSQWSLLPGDIFTTPYQTYNAIADYNSLTQTIGGGSYLSPGAAVTDNNGAMPYAGFRPANSYRRKDDPEPSRFVINLNSRLKPVVNIKRNERGKFYR